jgi:fatty acid desaturase
MNAWRANSGFVAWPTLGLAAAVVGLTAGAWALRLGLGAPLWALWPLPCLASWLAFTVVHEAAHGNLGGTGRPRLDAWVGWALAWWLLAPFSAFQAIHLRHHAAVNEAERDPDHLVAGPPGLGLLVRCLAIVPWYWWFFLAKLAPESPASRARRPGVIAGGLAMIGALAAAAWVGLLPEALALWVLPAWLADAGLAFAFDWLPHHPHDRTDRFGNTRIVVLPGWLALPLLGQELHLVHHLWPRVPWYRYRAVWEADQEAIVGKGAWVWSPGGAPPSDGLRAKA